MCTLLNGTYTSVQHTPSTPRMLLPSFFFAPSSSFSQAREKRTSAWMRRAPLQPCRLCFCHTRVWRAEPLGQAALPGLAVPWIQHQKICFRAFRHFANRQQARGGGANSASVTGNLSEGFRDLVEANLCCQTLLLPSTETGERHPGIVEVN